MKKSTIGLIAGIFILQFVSSCKREEPTSWESDLMAPLAEGRITISDIVPDSLIEYDANCLWHLTLHEDLTGFDLDTLVQIPDTIISKSFVVPIAGGPFTIPAGQQIISEEENNLLRINDAELREVIVKSGSLVYAIRSFINGYLDCTYSIPGVTLNGVGTTIFTQTQPGSPNNPYVETGTIDLADHRIDLTGQSGYTFNRIYTNLLISAAVDAPTQTLVYGGDSVVIELKFIDPVIRYARGYFGQQLYELNETIDLAQNVNFPDGLLNLQGSVMKFNIQNGIGADAQLNFHNLSNYSAYNGTSVQLSYPPIYQPLNITRAFDNNGVVSTTQYEYTMNDANSNIDAFMENLPDELNLQADVLINPLGDVSDGHDFIYTDNALKATMDLDIPLNIGMQNLTFVDTMDISSSADLEANGTLYLYVKNAFPFAAKCNLMLVDNTGGYETIVENQSIDFAIETSTPGVTIPVNSVVKIPVTQTLLNHWNSDYKLVVQVEFNTPQFNTPSGLYKNYYMDFRVVADASILIKYE